MRNSLDIPTLPSEGGHLPDFERMSAITATLMLAYVLGNFVRIPENAFELNALGIAVKLTINTRLVNALLTSGLAITATSWLISSKKTGSTPGSAQHWVLPALTAWVLSISLSALPAGVAWWLALILGTAFLSIVWVAEFVTVNPKDEYFRIAASGLTALSFALYLALAINLRALQTRLVFLIPALSLPVVLITFRYLVLKLQNQRILDPANRLTSILAAAAIGVITGQFASAMHFLPISALSFGLALIAPIYAINILLGNMVDDRPKKRTYLESMLVLGLLWGIAIILR